MVARGVKRAYFCVKGAGKWWDFFWGFFYLNSRRLVILKNLRFYEKDLDILKNYKPKIVIL